MQFKPSNAGLCLHSSSLCKSLDSLSRNSLGKLETSPHVLPVSQESLSFTALYTMPLKPLSHILCDLVQTGIEVNLFPLTPSFLETTCQENYWNGFITCFPTSLFALLKFYCEFPTLNLLLIPNCHISSAQVLSLDNGQLCGDVLTRRKWEK